MDFDILQDFLVERGYSIAVRQDGWVSLLIRRGEERWVGDGADEADALADAVLKMFPSNLAWELLGDALAEAHALAGLGDSPPPHEAAEDAPALEQHLVQEDAPEPFVDEAAAGVLDSGGQDEGPEPDEATTADHEPAAAAERLDDTKVHIGSAPSLGPAVSTAPVSRAPQVRALPNLSVDEALEGITTLSETIDALLPEIAWMSPLYVRLQLTAWLGRARHLQEETQHAYEVELAVRRLAGRLGGVSKRWWPGSVPALQLSTTPHQAARGLKLTLAPAATWDDLAAAVEIVLEDEEDGWADGRALEPRPASVDQGFRRILSEMEALLGPLKVDGDPAALAFVGDVATGKALKEWAQRLRWMRGVAPSGEVWARAMGRLRWASQYSSAARQHLEGWLDPETAPREGTWAKALGEDPEKKNRQRKLRTVLRATPGPTAPPEDVAAWLARALLLGSDLNYRQITGLLAPHHGAVLGLASEDLGDVERKVRSRFRKLQKALREGATPSPPPDLDDTDSGESDEDGDQADPVGDLIDAVRARTDGKAAVFVSNRTDNDLKGKLERRLGLTIEWCDGSPRRVQSVAKQVQAGKYDLVILATGFAGHDADAILGKAAARGDAHFVRAYKGRPLATLRAIARDLGIRNEGGG